MFLSATAAMPRPHDLPQLALQPAVDLAHDVVELDGESGSLPTGIADSGALLDIETTTLDYDGKPITDWYASVSDYSNSFRMERTGFSAALAAAQLVAKHEEAVAVVQSTDGARFLVPLGVWNPVDESELSFDEVGGTPYWNGAKDHMLMDGAGNSDVEAVVFNGGDRWLNLTGHPVKLPKAP